MKQKFIHLSKQTNQFAKILNLTISNLKKTRVSDAKFLNAYRPKNMLISLNNFVNKFNIKLSNLIDLIKLAA